MTHSNYKKDIFIHTVQTSNQSFYQPSPLKIEPKIKKIYLSYCEAGSSKQQAKLLWKLIKLCHNNTIRQSCLAKILNLPLKNGPISINPLPSNLLEHNQQIGQTTNEKTTQLQFLFDFLKHIEENYFCWIIYYSQDLKVLNLKLLRQDQLSQFEDLFNPNLNLIGIFTTKQKTKIQRPYNAHQLQSEFNEDTTLLKIHTKSTPNNSTGSSWKNPQQISQTNVRTSQFKFRSISPKFNIGSKICMLKKTHDNCQKSNKSLSMMSKVSKNSKSQSIFHKVNFKNDNNKLSSKYLQQNKQFPPKIQKKVIGATKLKKESKLHRVQRVYKKVT